MHSRLGGAAAQAAAPGGAAARGLPPRTPGTPRLGAFAAAARTPILARTPVLARGAAARTPGTALSVGRGGLEPWLARIGLAGAVRARMHAASSEPPHNYA
jgi:hypothetical protein